MAAMGPGQHSYDVYSSIGSYDQKDYLLISKRVVPVIVRRTTRLVQARALKVE